MKTFSLTKITLKCRQFLDSPGDLTTHICSRLRLRNHVLIHETHIKSKNNWTHLESQCPHRPRMAEPTVYEQTWQDTIKLSTKMDNLLTGTSELRILKWALFCIFSKENTFNDLWNKLLVEKATGDALWCFLFFQIDFTSWFSALTTLNLSAACFHPFYTAQGTRIRFLIKWNNMSSILWKKNFF